MPFARIALLSACLLFLAAPAFAYPIAPVPLWQLTESAESIVVANVGELSADGRSVTLTVIETWKGETATSFAMPPGSANMCPASALYIPGETVVAFLATYKGVLQTVGMSYGSLYPRDDEREIFKARVEEAIALQRVSTSEADKRAWLVRTASRVATRWHGLYEIIPESDELHSFYDRRRKSKALSLTPAEARSIAAGFVAEPSTDRTLLMAMSLLAGYEDAALAEVFVAATETVMRREPLPWWAGDLVPFALARAGVSDRAVLARQDMSDCESAEERAARTRAWWLEGRAKGTLRGVLPVPEQASQVQGVGANTSD